MDPSLKIVTHLPLQELWGNNAFANAVRVRALTAADIQELLRTGPIQFVVVDIGAPPSWIQIRESFSFWKDEVQGHLASGDKAALDKFPGEYCYFASLWSVGGETAPIALLEKHH
jgi:hypothetical protein